VARPSTARDFRRRAPRAAGLALPVLLLVGAVGSALDASPAVEGERPAAGRYLVAAEQVRGSFFEHSVVLLLSYAGDGAIGLVVNHPTDLALRDILKGAADGAGELYLGGPVETGSIIVLLRSPSPPEKAMRLAGDLFVTVDPATLIERAARPDAAKELRLYKGYASWGPGQLDDEIARGDWIVASDGTEAVFDDVPEALWKKLHLRHHRLVAQATARGSDSANSAVRWRT
jgi:putative transcriptional regulator